MPACERRRKNRSPFFLGGGGWMGVKERGTVPTFDRFSIVAEGVGVHRVELRVLTPPETSHAANDSA